MKISHAMIGAIGALALSSAVMADDNVPAAPSAYQTDAQRDHVDDLRKEDKKARKEANKDAERATKMQKKNLKDQQKAEEEYLEKKHEADREKLEVQKPRY